MSIKMQMLNVATLKFKSSNSQTIISKICFCFFFRLLHVHFKYATDMLHYSVKTVDASYKLNDIKE